MDMEHLVGLSGGGVVCELLTSHDVRHIFGYPGGAALPLFDALYKNTSFDFVLARHEQGAGHMAEGYARASGKPGVILVTSGPGSSNLVTPMFDALLDSTPLVAICGQVATAVQGTGAFQEIDVMEMAKPYTKWSVCVQRVSDLPAIIDSAFHHAMEGRPGPVLVAVPKDVGKEIFDVNSVKNARGSLLRADKTKRGLFCAHRSSSDPLETIAGLHDRMDRVINLINRARSPIICAGNGVLNSRNGSALLREIAERASIPVVTTLLGLGSFDQNHVLSLGMIGTYGTPHANLAVQNADVILVLGARLDERVVGNAAGFAPRAREHQATGTGGILQFDIRADAVGKVIEPTELILGDLCSILPPIIPQLVKGVVDRVKWLDRIQSWRRQYHTRLTPDAFKQPYPLPQEVVAELSRQTMLKRKEKKSTISTGVGQHQMWMAKGYQWRDPRSFITSGGLGTMGFGLPAAIGAQLAQPGNLVVGVDGDGSFCMTMEELLTASENGIPVKVIIFNNQQLGMISQLQRADYRGRICHAKQANPDFVKLARSMNCEGGRCSSKEELVSSIDWLLQSQGPAVLEVRIAETEMVPIVPGGGSLDVMKLE